MQNYRPQLNMPPAVKVIIIINVVLYLASTLLEKRYGIELAQYLGLHIPPSEYWRPHQYITHMFMHGGVSHIFFNMFAVFMFGRVLEGVWGTKRFVFYYLVTGIGAALLHSAVGMWEYHNMYNQFLAFQNTPDPSLLSEFIRSHVAYPQDWVFQFIDGWTSNPDNLSYIAQGKIIAQKVVDGFANIPTVGASGAVFGILLAFGMLFPNTELFIMFIPIPIKAKYFVVGYGLVELFLGIQNNVTDNVAHFAHLGGMLFGFLLLMWWKKNRKTFY